jgi:hypothetical protein
MRGRFIGRLAHEPVVARGLADVSAAGQRELHIRAHSVRTGGRWIGQTQRETRIP